MQNPKCNDPAGPVIPLPGGPDAPILIQDRGLIVIDKPAGWRGEADDPETTARNLQRALETAVESRVPWAVTLGIDFLRVVLAPDASASGPTLLGTTLDSARNLARLLGTHAGRPEEQYLAVVGGKPNQRHWTCCLKIRPDPDRPGRVLTDTRRGLHAETEFEVIAHGEGMVLIMATPTTRRPHQIRAHLAAVGLPIVGDTLYGFGRDLPRRGRRDHLIERTAPARDRLPEAGGTAGRTLPLALRSIRLAFPGLPGQSAIDVTAPVDDFLARFGFVAGIDGDPAPPESEPEPSPPPDPQLDPGSSAA